MNTRAQLKALSKEQIKKRIPILFLCQIIIIATSCLCNLIPFAGPLVYAILIPSLQLGFVIIYLRLTANIDPDPAVLFSRISDFWKNFCLVFFLGLFVSLWSLLLVIPGIIKAYSYSMSYYILADNPEISSLEAITRSRQMMKGHKMTLFILQLSFLPWILLVLVSLGIASIYVTPYVSATMANFYRNISGTVGTVIDEKNQFPGLDV